MRISGFACGSAGCLCRVSAVAVTSRRTGASSLPEQLCAGMPGWGTEKGAGPCLDSALVVTIRRRRRFTPSYSNDTTALSRSAGSHWLGSVVHGRIEQLSGGPHDASERCRHVSFH
jgi:hypothetical protein